MSTTLPPGPGTESAGGVAVPTESLIVGRRLSGPMHDERGVLLLSGGSIVTERFRDVLLRRGLSRVRIGADDVASLTITGHELSDRALQSELGRQVSDVTRGNNRPEPPLKDSLAGGDPGRDFDEDERREAEAINERATDYVSGLFRCGVNDREASVGRLQKVVSEFVAMMKIDMDLVLVAAEAVAREDPIAHHCVQMATLGMAIGAEHGYDARAVKAIGLCGLLHDWGMARVRPELLSAERRLTPIEFLEVQKHPAWTLELLQTVKEIPAYVPLVCYQVHERPNGTGYPRGVRGPRIHEFARILRAADVYVGLTSPRPYRPPLMPHYAVEAVLRMASDGRVDQNVARELLLVLSLFPPGSLVELADGSIGETIRRNGPNYARPIVRLVRNAEGARPSDESTIVDLEEQTMRVVRVLPRPDRDEVVLSTEILEQDAL